jgi:hypothetical protein
MQVPLGQCLRQRAPPPRPRAATHADEVERQRRIGVITRWPCVWSRGRGGGGREHKRTASFASSAKRTSALSSRDRRLCMGCAVRPLGQAARRPLLRHAEQRGSDRKVCTVGKRSWAAVARRSLRIDATGVPGACMPSSVGMTAYLNTAGDGASKCGERRHGCCSDQNF